MALSSTKIKISPIPLLLTLLLTCTSPLIIQAAGSSDEDDSDPQKSRNYQEAVSYIKKSDYSSAIPLLRRELKRNS